MADPKDTFSELKASAIAMHEWFCSLVGAGFTTEEALYLIAQISVGFGKQNG